MLDSQVWQWALLVLLCGAAVGVTLRWVLPVIDRCAGRMPVSGAPPRAVVWLFDGAHLIEATPAARGRVPDGHDWGAVCATLRSRFPELPDDPAAICDLGPVVVPADASRDAEELTAECTGGITRIELRPAPASGLPGGLNLHRLRVMETELDRLRRVTEGTPYPVWQIDSDGRLVWYNAAYRRLCIQLRAAEPDPDKRLFQSALDEKPSGSKVRCSLAAGGKFLWYDVTITRFDDIRQFSAVDVNAVVMAETAQRNFVQTLAKTFAQLSIGLAIFDRSRQLALFNPALIDLTALPAEFLSARPNLLSFFDKLRDNRMMPEPKNYGTWRDQLADLVAAAADGSYVDTWTLPSGCTYRVSGRPHPDGAVAFLFEDITAEVSLTRRFRDDLELSQSILDHLDEAIAVFASNGVMTLSNLAFRDMWQIDPDGGFAEVSVVDAIRKWQAQCAPSPFWGDLRDFVLSHENRSDWGARVVDRSGRPIECLVQPIRNGATMLRFRCPRAAREPPRAQAQHSMA
ncbi:MAG: PAS-domain containing protein [Rhodobacteraceae bacterium]|nr:PAS-domain containing protein [Paracoccaceae bacterium]